MTSRRTFFRVLGGALVGVAVAPSVLIEPLSPPSFWRSQATLGASRPLTLKLLREVYAKCSIGYGSSPQFIIAGAATVERYQSLARECGLIFDAEIAA